MFIFEDVHLFCLTFFLDWILASLDILLILINLAEKTETIVVLLVDLECVKESTSMLVLGDKVNVATKPFDNKL